LVAEMEQSAVPTRDQVPVAETWDLTTIYPNDEGWEQDAARLKAQLAAAAAHRGQLGASATELRQALDDVMAARLTMERLQVYAALRKDEDATDDAAVARYQRAVALAVEAGEALAFVQPEILAIPTTTLAEYTEAPPLAPYRHLLHDLQRQRPHVRSIEVEEVLAQGSEVAHVPHEAFSALDDADLDFGTVRDERGNEVALSKARAMLFLRSQDRDLRRAAWEGLMGAYLAHRHTLAALHGASVRKDVFAARVRGYATARQAALFEANIPEAVYDNLLAAVRAARPTIARYLELRRRILGVAQLTAYDLYVPLAPEPERRYAYQEATDVVLAGLRPLGEGYVGDLAGGFAARWVDVHETKGKRAGAYSWGIYGAPPVILLNWNGTVNDVFTLAHEAGHAMHSLYADAAQPYHDAGYSLFLAEIASTVNEVLLTWSLLDQTPPQDRAEHFALLNRLADNFFSTLVRQAMFADFEARTHARAEVGQPLTVGDLNALYGEVYAAYTPGVAVDDAVRLTWARVPHFYRAFYVYQYATGLSAAVALARAIRDEGQPAVARYLGMLAAGGSDYPLPLLQRAGVDLTTPAPIEAALAEFARTVAEMARLVEEGALNGAGTV